MRKRKDSTDGDKEKSSPASRKGSKKSSPKNEEDLEDQMTSLLKKINDKSRFIKL